MSIGGTSERPSSEQAAGPMRGEATESSPVVLDRNLACVRCTYNLRGLPANGNCPECGEPIATSVKLLMFQGVSKFQLARTRLGLTMIQSSMLTDVPLTLAPLAAGALHFTYSSKVDRILAVVGLVIRGVGLLGTWKYTSIGRENTISNTMSSAQRSVRIAIVGLVGLVLIRFLMELQLLGELQIISGPADLLQRVLFFETVVAGVVIGFGVAEVCKLVGVMNITAWIGMRMQDEVIVRRARIFRWLLPIVGGAGVIPGMVLMRLQITNVAWGLLLAGPCAAVVLYWGLLARVRKHIVSIQETGMAADLPGRLG